MVNEPDGVAPGDLYADEVARVPVARHPRVAHGVQRRLSGVSECSQRLETLRLRIAMTQNACDSPVIKTIEKNMIGHVMAH